MIELNQAPKGYESFSYGGVDPCMWEPQELGKKCFSFIHSLLSTCMFSELAEETPVYLHACKLPRTFVS